MVSAREASRTIAGSSCPPLHPYPCLLPVTVLPQLFPYQQGKLRLHLLQVGAHGSRRVQQDAHFPLQNDSEQSAAPCSRVGGDRGQGGGRVVFPTAAIKDATPAPNLIACGSDVNPWEIASGVLLLEWPPFKGSVGRWPGLWEIKVSTVTLLEMT